MDVEHSRTKNIHQTQTTTILLACLPLVAIKGTRASYCSVQVDPLSWYQMVMFRSLLEFVDNKQNKKILKNHSKNGEKNWLKPTFFLTRVLKPTSDIRQD